MDKNITIVISLLIILIMLAGLFFFKFGFTGKSVVEQNADIIALSAEHKSKIIDIISSSEIIKDIPDGKVISLRFFDFVNGDRIWQDEFLLTNNQSQHQLLGENASQPEIYITLHSKYISEITNNNLCEVLKKANKNRDLGFYSEYNKAVLLIKYTGMLKYRECLGV